MPEIQTWRNRELIHRIPDVDWEDRLEGIERAVEVLPFQLYDPEKRQGADVDIIADLAPALADLTEKVGPARRFVDVEGGFILIVWVPDLSN